MTKPVYHDVSCELQEIRAMMSGDEWSRMPEWRRGHLLCLALDYIAAVLSLLDRDIQDLRAVTEASRKTEGRS